MHRIIIVDDEVVIAETLTLILQYSGHQVAAFTSPAEALTALGESGADVLITDMLMPAMNGLELAAAAQKLCPDCHILLVSGRELSKGTRLPGQGSSNVEFLMKPMMPEQLLAKLQELPSMAQRSEALSFPSASLLPGSQACKSTHRYRTHYKQSPI